MQFFTLESNDGKVLVCNPFLGWHFMKKSDIETKDLWSGCQNPDPTDEEKMMEVLEGHVPVVQIFPRREWAEAIRECGLYDYDSEDLVIVELTPVSA